MNQKVLCIGDSLSLPGHLNKYEDTWFFKIKNQRSHYDFISFFKRQLTTDVLVGMGGGKNGIDRWPKGADCLEAYMPQIIIIQLGIVDCAPRLLFDLERRIIGRLNHPVREAYISWVKKLRTRREENTMVSYESFIQNIERYISRAINIGIKKIIFIGIPIPDDRMISKNPEIVSNIQKYNHFYREISDEYPPVQAIFPLNPEKYQYEIYEDGYHPNSKGHDLITGSLERII